MAREKGLELRMVPTRLWVRSDRRLLRRVLQNLVSNAIKYTAGRQGAARRAPARRPASACRSATPAPASPGQARAHLQGVRAAARRRRARCAASGSGLSIVERIGKVLGPSRRAAVGAGPRLDVLGGAAARRAQALGRAVAAPMAPSAGRIAGLTVLCIDNEPAGPARHAGAARAAGAAPSSRREARRKPSRSCARRLSARTSSSPTTISTTAPASEAVAAAARRGAGRRSPVIVITADHSAEVQREVRLQRLCPAAQAAEGGGAARADAPAHLAARPVAAEIVRPAGGLTARISGRSAASRRWRRCC